MDEAPSEQPPAPQKRSWLGALLVLFAIGGSAIGVFIYQMMQGSRKSGVDVNGFDIAQTTENRAVISQGGSPSPQQSGLGMVTGATGLAFGSKTTMATTPAQQKQESLQSAADDFNVLCVQNEDKVHQYIKGATARNPVLKQYAKDWMSYPDLKQLNDNYLRYHDAIAFMRGLAKSDNFPKLVTKYATDPGFQSFIKDSMTHVPSDLMKGGVDFISKDNLVKDMVDKVTSSLGLPAGLFGGGGGAAGGAAGGIDANKIMGGVLDNNPQMQKAMEGHPEIQQQLDSAKQSAAKAGQNH